MKYINIKSHIHNINASIKILYLLFYLVLCFLPNNFDYIRIGSFIITTYLVISSKVPLKYYFQTISKTFFIIVAIFVLCASLNLTLINSILIVLSFIFGLALYALIIYTTEPLNLAFGIYNIVKPLNVLNLSPNYLFMKIYNMVLFISDYKHSQKNIIDALELKGRVIRDQNIISRFFIKLDLMPLVLKNSKKMRQLRNKRMIREKFDVNNYSNQVHLIDIIYLLAFVLLIIIYISKVI